MDKSIPAGAAILLDFIGDTETKTSVPAAYNVIFANRQGRLRKPITQMTIAEIQSGQLVWRKWEKPHSSAAGRYQFMYDTLKGLISELRLSTAQIFDANLQDRLAFHLLRRRGYDAFMTGQITRTEFGKRLAMEWASLPVLADTKNSTGRTVRRGQSFYAGDGLNKSLTKPETVEAVLIKAKQAGGGLPSPAEPAKTPAAAPTKPATGKDGTIAAGGAVVCGGAATAAVQAGYSPELIAACVVGVVLIIGAFLLWKNWDKL